MVQRVQHTCNMGREGSAVSTQEFIPQASPTLPPVTCRTWCQHYGTPREGHAGVSPDDQMCQSPTRVWAGVNGVSALYHHESRALHVYVDEDNRDVLTLTPQDAAGLLVALRRVMGELASCGDA